MKELSIEEKAKRYDEALSKAKKELDTCGSQDCDAARQIFRFFPELKESEDEKIRKELISLIKKTHVTDRYYDLNKMLAWLEKQGEKIDAIENFNTEFEKQVSHLIASAINKEHEYNNGFVKWTANALLNYAKHELEKQGKQKPIDKIEPKFHAGDFITDGERIFQIKETVWERNNRNDGSTYCESLIVNLRDGNTYADNTDLKEYHLWTIQDAKDGDILAWSDSNCIAIFSKIENDESFISHGFIGNITGVFKKGYGGHSITNLLHPATKEQRDLLFTKMKEVGYEWDSENKVLRKIEPNPAWSEEDERMLNRLIKYFDWGNGYYFNEDDYVEVEDWLKSLKERVQSKPKQ